MDKILIHGGRPLSGSIKISGSKNSALPYPGRDVAHARALHPAPRAGPERHAYMLQILMHLGAQVERASGTVTGQCREGRIDRSI
jgi:UDP-N-acetylglucosamine 1-carboxyvinyltransferase